MNFLVRWFVHNPIAANLLMLTMLIGGYIGYGEIKKETVPTHIANDISINMSYPGAAPSEVEQQIVVRIEEAIAGLPGIYQITSESREGFGSVNVRVIEGFDVRALLNDIKGRVDAINTFPVSAEKPVIRQSIYRQFLMWIALYGDAELRELKNYAYQISDEMSQLEGVSEVRIIGSKSDEVSIEISEATLRRFNLTFSEVASAIRSSSLNVPAGALKTKDGDIRIQTRAQAYGAQDFEKVVVRSSPDGGRLLLSDIAEITDGFGEQDGFFSINGKPGLNLEIKMSDDPLLYEGTENARKYVEEFNKYLPDYLTLKINFESKSIFDSRFNLLKDNAISGLVLVFIVLMLFLRPLLAFWVVAGIATTFAGAIWLLPYLHVSINMLSMFAFLMVLGIVVDDAIIVGESVYRHQKKGENGDQAAVSGTRSVLSPVMLAVISTVIFFVPMITVPTETLIYTRSIFYVVLLCLLFSLAEAIFVLPSHLSHMKPEKPSRFRTLQWLAKIREQFSEKMEQFCIRTYQPLLKKVLNNGLGSGLIFSFAFIIAMTIAGAGWIKTSFFPDVPQPMVMINVGFSEGVPFSLVQAASEHVLKQVDAVNKDKKLLDRNKGKPFIREVNRSINNSSFTVFVGLVPAEQRTITTSEVTEQLRDLIGPLPEAQTYSLSGDMNGSGPEITLHMNIIDNRRSAQSAAVEDVKKVLASYSGVYNVRSNLEAERSEIELELKPYAETLGISLAEVARQVRQGFYGEEIQRIPRAKEDVRVMLRYPAAERRTLDTLDQVRIRTADGREIPIEAVAEIKFVPGSSVIRRIDRRRNITITAEVAEGNDPNKIVDEIFASHMAQWRNQHLGFSISKDGSLRMQREFEQNFFGNFGRCALLVLALFAIVFRSLFQPFLIMLAVPFGFVGAVLGHLLVGVELSIFSFFGFLACSGVVVNDNLVLLERINTLKSRGLSVVDAVLNAGVDRFRPIVLTSLTTFIGLMPILFERSQQAQFLIPMVVALSFGVLFSSVATLFLVPLGYVSANRSKERLVNFLRCKRIVQPATQ